MIVVNSEWFYGPILVLVLVLGLVMVAYIRLARRFVELRKKDRGIEERAREEAEAALERAKDRSLAIIEESRLKAEEIIMESDFVSEDMRSHAKDELRKVSEKEVRSYKRMLDEVKEDTAKVMGSVSKGIENEAESEIEGFRKAMQNRVVEMQAQLQAKVEAEYDKVSTEVEGYKEERLKEAEEKIRKLVGEVSREVLGRAIDLSDHEELVMRALERAKREGVI